MIIAVSAYRSFAGGFCTVEYQRWAIAKGVSYRGGPIWQLDRINETGTQYTYSDPTLSLKPPPVGRTVWS